MKNVTKFLLDAENADIVREVLKACKSKGIDFYKIEESLKAVLYEPDIRTINFLIIEKVLGGINVVSTKGRAYFDRAFMDYGKILEGILFPFTRKTARATKEI